MLPGNKTGLVMKSIHCSRIGWYPYNTESLFFSLKEEKIKKKIKKKEFLI